MKTLQGKPISPGYAQGYATVFGTAEIAAPQRCIGEDEVDEELARFHIALRDSRVELDRLQERVQSELGSAEADIFSAHLLFLQDPQFIGRVESGVKNDRLAIDSAIAVTVAELVTILCESDNAYLRERAEDIRDLGRRLSRNLARQEGRLLSHLAPGSVIIARELLPTDLLEIDRDHLVGIVTELGGETGHAAILARALGIPAVTGITGATQIATAHMKVVVDGVSGEVAFDPAAQYLADFLARQTRYEDVKIQARSAEKRECVTRDGVRISLYANIGRPDDVEQVAEHRLEGVGLFRTEYLFLDEPQPPSIERQSAIYRQIAQSLGSRPLVIRTLDLGGDKRPAFLAAQFEANPNLGIRGLRFSLLATQELFRTQIRAVLALAHDFDVQILLPMVLGASDFRQARSIIEEIAVQEGIEKLPPVGALIETPAAVFSINEILAACDFISIGTNDLTQFILAADRNALALIDDYTVLHPSVLRAIHAVMQAASSSGKPATVCGEAAADPRVACLLVGMGARRLSMSPVSAARVRYALHAARLPSLEQLASAALAADSAEAAATLVDEALRHAIPEFWEGAISV